MCTAAHRADALPLCQALPSLAAIEVYAYGLYGNVQFWACEIGSEKGPAAMQDAAEGREVVLLVFDFMDKHGVWQTRPDAYNSAIRRLQQVCMISLAYATGCVHPQQCVH